MKIEKAEIKRFSSEVAEFVSLSSALRALQENDIEVVGIVFGDPRVTEGKVKAILAEVLAPEEEEKKVAWIYM